MEDNTQDHAQVTEQPNAEATDASTLTDVTTNEAAPEASATNQQLAFGAVL